MANLSEMRKKSSKRISMFSGNSLGFKLLSAFIVIIVIVLSLYTAFSISREESKARRNLLNKGQMLANLLSYGSRIGVFAEDRGQLTDVTAGFLSEPDVVLVAIYNQDGKTLYLSNRGTAGREASTDPAAGRSVVMPQRREIEVEETISAIGFVKPVILKIFPKEEQSLYFDENGQQATERVIGYVRIVLGKESLHREVLSILVRNAVIALIFIAATVALVYYRVKKVTRPLETLTQKVRALGEGGEIDYVPVETRDEIGRLAMAFNTMLDERRTGREAFQKILMEIHDGIGGITTNISLLSELARKAISPESVSQALATISSLSKEGMAEIRSLMYSLDRTNMSWDTLSAELRSRGTRTLEPHGIGFELATDIEEDTAQPASLLCLHLFRVYREALTNIIKHSRATTVTTSVLVRQGYIIFEVRDDGEGCEEAVFSGNGRGISHIKARAAELGGRATITGDNGTRVTVEIPLPNKNSSLTT